MRIYFKSARVLSNRDDSSESQLLQVLCTTVPKLPELSHALEFTSRAATPRDAQSSGSCRVDFLLVFSCVGVFRLIGNSITPSRASSTLLSITRCCFCTVSAICKGHILNQRETILKAHESYQTDMIAARRSSFKLDVRMFRSYRNFRTHSNLLVERRRRETPTVVEHFAWIFCSFCFLKEKALERWKFSSQRFRWVSMFLRFQNQNNRF